MSKHNFTGHRRLKPCAPCAACGGDWLRSSGAEKLCHACRETLFWCTGAGTGTGHVAPAGIKAGPQTCRSCRLLRHAAIRSRARGIPLALDWRYVESLWPDACPYLGIPLVAGTHKLSRSSPTMDRVDPSRGYVEGNVEIVSFQANSMKNDATEDQLVTFALEVLRRHAPVLLEQTC
jgi:hypothetical protein